ncbi:protein-cysteine n-palmitoyltransferase hhat-like [Plakobranchus ocellatus]|uniref:Protein-cysteine n-palmitoyltransferase hhat-like n=1 Tax=Plakobranchus ocellatus TaxID=259542 RepID=A0AAV4AM97_9GAST|nr:protein-cysteine n-palmitoyltransferase hhat-like [Plakobranchus ocellatus]
MLTFQENMVQDILPKWERWAYWVTGIYGVYYCWWRVFIEGDALRKRHLHFGLRKNWSFLDRSYDFSDNDWLQWMIDLKVHLMLCLIHIATSQICRLLRLSLSVRLCGLLLCDLSCLCVIFGYKVVVFFLFKVLLVYLISQLGSVAGIWIVLGADIITLTLSGFMRAQSLFLELSKQSQFYPAIGFLFIKLISFGVDNAQIVRKNLQNQTTDVPSGTTLTEKKITSTDDITQSNETPMTGNTKSSLLHLLESLVYLFYLPSFIYGPLIMFEDFRLQIKASFAAAEPSPTFLPKNCINILKHLMRLVFWMLFMEFSLHYLYFNAIAYNSALKKLSFCAVGGIVHLLGQFFTIKYVVFYGFGGQLGRFDGINPYPEPRCINVLSCYIDVWKNFDTGLHKFLKTYLYIPVGGSRHGLIRQIASLAVSFLFIFLWHGGTGRLFIWSFGNFLVCSIEQLGRTAERSPIGQRLVSVISPAMQLRMKCLLLAFSYITYSLQAFFFFFHGYEARIMCQRLVVTSTWLQFGCFVGVIYACIHNAKFMDCKLGKRKKFS